MNTFLAYKTTSSIDCFIGDTAFTKAISTWQQGSGGMLDTGSLAANTSYHLHVITDGSALDLLASIAPINPLLPSGWALVGQVAGSLMTGSTGAIRPFTQNGNEFRWLPPVTDLDTVANSTDTLRTVSVPMGVKVLYICFAYAPASSAGWVLMDDPDHGALAANAYMMRRNSASSPPGHECRVWTNASQQIRTKDSVSGATITMIARGYLDPRVDA